MRKFWGFYKNDAFSAGCNGGTVFVYDNNGRELYRFKDIPYAYKAAFMPGRNIIAVKSTMGYICFYDLENGSLIKKHTVTTMGAQDEGFTFSADGRFFYNIEKPRTSTATQLGVYDTSDFSKSAVLFDDDDIVLSYLEVNKDSGVCYVSGFFRDAATRVFEKGFVAVFDEAEQKLADMRFPDRETYNYLTAYKAWELSGFTEKALEWNYPLRGLAEITPVSIKSVHSEC